ncbi:ABC transporter ATP-binding protein [Pilimelia columellifera]|uniref:ABC transporter ATP-binding protein n=1 Tax=Pilimelia columellifera subsp. columellifera TaxID=706583 RepID=A0ABN3NG33_9ACTN
MTTVLDAQLRVDRPGFRLDLAFTLAAGEVVALLGPNGAGKTTALRALAGLCPLTDGRIILDGRAVDEPAAGRWVPPERRRVGVVFQDYLLFPHLTTLDNVAFGLRAAGGSARDARVEAAGWLDRMGLATLSASRPARLSGGQAQRVALARALAPAPRLLLLDEPMAALDVDVRARTRAELRRGLAEHPGATLLVTHDPLDALTLASRLLIVENGRLVQSGDAATVTARPRTEYVARLVGLNLYRGRAEGVTVRVAEGLALTVAAPVHGDAFVAISPSAVALYAERPSGSPRNCWPATVVEVRGHGDQLRAELTGPVSVAADLTPAAVAQLRLVPGLRVWVGVKAAETLAYPA